MATTKEVSEEKTNQVKAIMTNRALALTPARPGPKKNVTTIGAHTDRTWYISDTDIRP